MVQMHGDSICDAFWQMPKLRVLSVVRDSPGCRRRPCSVPTPSTCAIASWLQWAPPSMPPWPHVPLQLLRGRPKALLAALPQLPRFPTWQEASPALKRLPFRSARSYRCVGTFWSRNESQLLCFDWDHCRMLLLSWACQMFYQGRGLRCLPGSKCRLYIRTTTLPLPLE